MYKTRELSIMHHILHAIRSTSSNNEKESILRQHKDNNLLRRVLEMTYSPLIKFGVKKLPEPSLQVNELFSLSDALDQLMRLANREATGNAALDLVSYILGHVSPEDAQLISLILDGSLKLGCNVSTINKAIGKNFIKEAPYQGAVSYDAKKVAKLFAKRHTVFSQLKLDGRYANVVCESDSVSMESRQGLPTYFGEHFNFLAGLKHFNEPVVLNGELIIHGMDRYTSNGIISSLVSIGDKIQDGQSVDKELAKLQKEHGDTYESLLSQVKLVVWDFIPQSVYTGSDKWFYNYSNRLADLKEMLEGMPSDKISIVESIVVTSPKEAMDHFLSARNRGEEGTILKGDAHWQDGKPTHQIKFKNEIDLDLVLVDGNLGTPGTKNENVISSVNVVSQCGKLSTSPGGMNEALMKWVTENIEKLKGTIVKVKCNGVSQDRDGNYSLLHPCVVEFRNDKTVGNTLEECIEIDASSKEIVG
jgi:DNA ligase-1